MVLVGVGVEVGVGVGVGYGVGDLCYLFVVVCGWLAGCGWLVVCEQNTLTRLSPTSSTTTTSQRPLKSSSRSPPAKAGPQTCMTWRSMTTPSAERSLHHCSLRSEKIQRAVDKLITLLKKVCCHVSRCLSVMLEQGDLFPMSLDH